MIKQDPTSVAAVTASSTPTSIYRPDEIGLMIPGGEPVAQPIPHGTESMASGSTDIRRSSRSLSSNRQPFMTSGRRRISKLPCAMACASWSTFIDQMSRVQKFPAIVAYGLWGKDAQEAVAWNRDKPQRYYDSPFWDGTMEAGDYTYTVPRGFAHVIPEPRGVGASEGDYPTQERIYNPKDIHDIIEWVAAQPWCNGKVGMMGPSSYSRSQLYVAASDELPPHLVAIHPDELPLLAGSYFHGIFDTLILPHFLRSTR